MKPRKPDLTVREKARLRDGDVVNLAPMPPRRTLQEWAEILPPASFVGEAVRTQLERDRVRA